jgi:hypothetical protein
VIVDEIKAARKMNNPKEQKPHPQPFSKGEGSKVSMSNL